MRRLLSVVVFSFGVAGLVFADTATTPITPVSTDFTSTQTSAIQKIVHDYLLDNPQVLIEVSQKLQAQQVKKMESEATAAIGQNKATLFNDSGSPSIGDKTATVTVVEFFDYQCGHCRQMAKTIENLLSDNKNIHFIFKELPIFGAQSTEAAKAALAANMQSSALYYKFHNALLEGKGFSSDVILATAKKAGLNIPRLKRDMKSERVDQEIRSNFELAKALKIPGTPAFVIANHAQTQFRYIPGAATLEDLQAQIKAVE